MYTASTLYCEPYYTQCHVYTYMYMYIYTYNTHVSMYMYIHVCMIVYIVSVPSSRVSGGVEEVCSIGSVPHSQGETSSVHTVKLA